VVDKVASKSKTDRGIVTVETRGYNQRGEEVCFFRRKVLVPVKAAAKPFERPYTSADGDGD
jgi:acyl dehydratase